MSLSAEIRRPLNRFVAACGGQVPLFASEATPEINEARAELETAIQQAMSDAALEAVERVLGKLAPRREA